eukprot:TRINITY_DN14265_c0_g1_i1.p1 TRINITY_DN14265_c0_g1~~TRINITY_DN14265_c0_g1_i1.p1  ORF type:complete len:405 (+),score=41.06 TRINITY_DN14265_c0_g1_i1:91-1305(+)
MLDGALSPAMVCQPLSSNAAACTSAKRTRLADTAGRAGRKGNVLGAELRSVPRHDWQPDGSSPSCTACAARFSWRRRRHHCRGCGALVCASCSAQEIALPRANGQGCDKVRVCDACSTLRLDAAAGPSAQLPLPSPRAASQCPAASVSPSSPWTPRSPPPPSDPSSASPGGCYWPQRRCHAVPASRWADPQRSRHVVFTDARTGAEHDFFAGGYYGRLHHRVDGAERLPVHSMDFCSDGVVYLGSADFVGRRRMDPPDAAAVQRLWNLARDAGVELTALRVTAYCTMPNGLRVPAEYAPPAEAPPPARPWYKVVADRFALRRRGDDSGPQRTGGPPKRIDDVQHHRGALYAPSASRAAAAAETAEAPARGPLDLCNCGSGAPPRPAPRHLGPAQRLRRWIGRAG